MANLTPDSLVVANDSSLATTLDDEVVVYNEVEGSYQSLTGTGPEIWESIQEPTSVREIQQSVAETYDVEPERCEQDVLQFLRELADTGLLVTVDEYSE